MPLLDASMSFGALRAAASDLSARLGLSRAARGETFDGNRHLDTTLGYKAHLSPADYRHRFDRGGIAARIVEAMPKACFRGGGELVEDEDSSTVTDFEANWFALADRLHIWATLLRADILAGLGRYSVLLIGAPGLLETPLEPTNRPDDLLYLTPFSEDDASIEERDLVSDAANSRFGLPEFYRFRRIGGKTSKTTAGMARPVHWTRIVHVADGLLDEALYGQPRLERVWNKLDDLDKVTGGGAEAFWLRAHQGLQLNLDKDAQIDEGERTKLSEQVDEYEHNMRRVLRTKGVTVTALGSDVADFSSAADAVLTQIAGATGIPKRILTGSEVGQLASTQDRSNFRDQVTDRRTGTSGPLVVRPLVDRLIKFGFLPTPKQYDVRWPTMQFLDDVEIANVANVWAQINAQYQGEVVITPDEIRDRLLGLPPLTEVLGPTGSIVTASMKVATWRALGRAAGTLTTPRRRLIAFTDETDLVVRGLQRRSPPAPQPVEAVVGELVSTPAPIVHITLPSAAARDRVVSYDAAGRITRIRSVEPEEIVP